MSLKKRKSTRLKGYNYSSPGSYFITICTKGRKCLLSDIIVGTGILDGPQSVLKSYGKIANNQLLNMSDFYDNIKVNKFVIMPNHIHLLIDISDNSDGPSGTPVPTNTLIAQFVGTFKRFCDKEYGENIWQSRSHDHIIRNETDYKKIWEYIDTNVVRWKYDCFYTEETEQ